MSETFVQITVKPPTAASTAAAVVETAVETVPSYDIGSLTVSAAMTAVAPAMPLPRTTAYRKKRAAAEGHEASYKRHKTYNCCRRCGQPLIAATGHSKYRSYTYCPSSGTPKDVWMAEIDDKKNL